LWQEPEEKRDDEDEPQTLPKLALRELLDLLALTPRQHFTQPPPRYSESSLIKALEERGIGRPSTYAGIINTLKDRAYVSSEKRVLLPTELGVATCDALVLCFPAEMDYRFTAQVEDWLDDVSRGEREWTAALQAFYTPFAQALSEAPGKLQAVLRVPGAPRPTRGGSKRPRRGKRPGPAPEVNPDLHCPQCNAPMVKRQSKHGAFWGCTRYPNCKGTRKI
jgi:DNA topoisomerase I